ncbi:hypothetical protein VARIO8X_110075 [Burkholderiales bacterium 8X]|nr:hypothetical protein VARIO8X_110075 [Burkholderiales bacterium 8X]
MSRSSQRGLTLIELMVAMVLGLLVTASIGTVYLIASRNLTQQDAEARLQQSGAAAMAAVAQQIQKAGLVDMPADWPGWQDATPGMDRFAYLMQHSTDTSAIGYLPVTLHGCDNDYADDNKLDSPDCKAGASGSAAITLAWQVNRTGEGAIAPVATLPCLGSEGVMPGRDVDDLSHVDAATGATRPVKTHWAACRIGLNPADDSIQFTQTSPHGKATAFFTHPVADNVVDLRFRYLVGMPGNSSRLSRYALAAEFMPAGLLDWADVTGIEVCLLTRVGVPATDTKTFDGCEIDGSTNAPKPQTRTDAYLYRAVRSVVVLRSRVQATSSMTP